MVESLRAGVPSAALYVGARVQHDERISEAIKLAADRGVAVLEAGAAELDRLTGGALHQGLALRVRPYDYAHPDDLLARAADAGELPLIAALDGVTDPRNLGAVVRSAAAFGAHGVVVPGRRGAGVTAGAWKASAGALARVPVARAVNLARALQSYQDAGVFVAGLDAAGDTAIRDLELATAPLVLVIGSEGRGPVADRGTGLRRAGPDPDRGPHRVAERGRGRGHRAVRGGRGPVSAHQVTAAGPVKRAAVVIHPGKHDDLDGFRAVVRQAMTELGWAEPLWLETRPDDTGERLAAEAVRSGVDLVLASGGDGTITACAAGVAGWGSRLACCRAAPGICSPATSACRCP